MRYDDWLARQPDIEAEDAVANPIRTRVVRCIVCKRALPDGGIPVKGRAARTCQDPGCINHAPAVIRDIVLHFNNVSRRRATSSHKEDAK